MSQNNVTEAGLMENFVSKLLKTKNDELKAFHYSLESLDYSINQEIEIR